MKIKIIIDRLAIGFLFTLVAWTTVNFCIVKLSLFQWIIIEFIIGICEYFCKFVKDHIDIQ